MHSLLVLVSLSVMLCGSDPSAEQLLSEARAALKEGQLDKALELAGKAVKEEPKNSEAYLVRGSIYESARRHTEAIADFDKTIVLDPEIKVRKFSLGEGKMRRIELAEVGNEAGPRRKAQNEPAPTFKITATLKPSISAEAAVRLVADQARLAVVVMDGAFYVTTPTNAQRLRQEMGKE